MRFNLANKAPVAVEIDGTEYKFPQVTRRFWVDWAASIDGQRLAQGTENLDPVQRSKMIFLHPVEPVGHEELIRRVGTPDGTGRIIRESATKGNIPGDVVNNLLENASERDLETLAILLSGILDSSKPQYEKKGEADPLASSPTVSGDSSKTS